MGNRWLCVQWNIDINESAEIKVLFSEFYSPHNFKLHIYINNFWSSNFDIYICYRANLDGFFLDGRILLNRFCSDIRAFPSFIELRIYRKIARIERSLNFMMVRSPIFIFS